MIEITLKLNDRLYADFVLFLEEHYADCDCPKKHSDPQVALHDLLRDCMLEHKVRKLADARAAERLKTLNEEIIKNPVGTLFELLRPIPVSPEDQETIKQWAAEYEEE